MRKDIDTITNTIIKAAEEARAEQRPLRILFVCLGNICRSPAAEGVMRTMAEAQGLGDMLELDSCGFYGGHVGDLPDRRMRECAWQRGYRLDHRSRVIRPTDFEHFDLIFGMDARNLDDLHRAALTVEDEAKILPMATLATSYPGYDYIPDPYYEGVEGFQLVLDLLVDACRNLLDIIKK